MALTYNQLSAITRDKFIKKLVDNIFDDIWYLNRMRTRKGGFSVQDGGLKIRIPLEYAQTSASGWYSGSDTLDTSDNETFTDAAYDWAFGYANITILRTDELKNMGDSQVINLVKSKTKNASKTLTDKLGTALFNAGTTTDAPDGLRHICSASNTVGGIAQGTYSWWQAQVDSTTDTTSISALQSLYGDCTVNNEQPSVGVTTQAIYNRIYGLLQPQQRFISTTDAKAGFTTIMMNGKPIGTDSHCPANYFFWINENYFDYTVHRDENFRFEPFMKPTNQNVKVAKVYLAGNFTSSNNRMHGVMSALAS